MRPVSRPRKNRPSNTTLKPLPLAPSATPRSNDSCTKIRLSRTLSSRLTVKPFLTANWRYLAMLNFVVDPAIVAPLVPPGTEIDYENGETFVSVVGFLFLDTRLLGLPIPLHRDFEEVNLRFYVRKKSVDTWRRNVESASALRVYCRRFSHQRGAKRNSSVAAVYDRRTSFSARNSLTSAFFLLCREIARSTSRDKSSGYGIPEASHSFGYMLIEVKPGIVFNSFKKNFPLVRSSNRSTRAIPSPSIVKKAFFAMSCTRLVCSASSFAGIISVAPFSSRYLAS